MRDLLRVEVQTPADIFTAASALLAAAAECGLDPRRSDVLADLIKASTQAQQERASLVLLENTDGQVVLALEASGRPRKTQVVWDRELEPSNSDHAPIPDLTFLAGQLTDVLASGAEAARQSAGRQAMVAALEHELAETNSGVMALYAELDEKADKLRRADELKSKFLSYASHELRTPLNGIVGLVRLLESGRVDRPAEELKQLHFIQRAAEELREIVDDLLDLAKVEAGKITIQPSEFGLELVFGALRGIFRPLLHTNVVLAFEDTSTIPSIYSDEGKVSQILRNFISNAIKFTENGSVRVWTETHNQNIRIAVTDTGIGIESAQQELVWQDFTQLDSPLQRRVRGTGLGLPLCRKLAEILGGSVTLESELGKGSTFSLILPLKYGTSAVDAASPSSVNRKRLKLMIVDDAEIDRYLLTHLLRSGGDDYEILHTEDGQAGLEAIRKERPDLVFLDLNLPRINGFAVLDELRKDPATRDVPVFAVTAEKLNEDDYRRLEAVSQGILLKDHLSQANAIHIDFTGSVSVVLT